MSSARPSRNAATAAGRRAARSALRAMPPRKSDTNRYRALSSHSRTVRERADTVPGRRILRGIASGLAGSFASRNNDHNGYWAPGVLYAHARRHQVRTVRLNLQSQRLTPRAAELVPIATRHADLLAALLAAETFDAGLISSAEIIVEFAAVEDFPPWPRHTYGDPYVCRVLLGHQCGKTYVAEVWGHAAPHDPLREMRRYGQYGP